MIKTMVLIPVFDNDGAPFSSSDWLQLESRLLAFGGLNWTDNVTGMWRSTDRVYQDRCRQYVVSLPSWLQLAAWLEVVLWARTRFRQVAIYIEVAGIPEVLE